MAKRSDDEAGKPRRGERTAAWLLTGMLVFGLGGYGVTNFSGGTVSSIGRVGGVDITTGDYARALKQEVAAFSQQVGTPVDTSTAIALGLDRRALSAVVTRAALDNEARMIGLSVGDDRVAEEIRKQQAFQGAGGAFDRDTYRRVLDQNGWSEADYEDTMRREAARALLQGAVTGGFAVPDAITGTLYRWIAERRGFSMIRLAEADLALPVPIPTDAELTAWYESNIADYTRPDAVRVHYAALLPEAIAAGQPVDEAVLRKLYDERRGEFVVPEKRLVERLVYPDAAARDAALAAAGTGTSFEDLVKARGLTLEAVDLGDVAEDELGPAGPAVFAAPDGGVVGAESDLGPALFRINGRLEGQETTFEEARPELAAEIQTDAARRVISSRVEEIDDLLAGGATLDDLARQMGMQTGTLDHVPGGQGEAPIEGYQAFRGAADKLKPGDFPEAVMLDDGGVVAMEFVEKVPAAPIPFDEVRERVASDWRADRLHQALAEQAGAFRTAAVAGAALDSLGKVEVTPAIARDGTVDGAPAALLEKVFSMTGGEVAVFDADGFTAVLRLDSIAPAPAEGPEAEALKGALAAQIEQAFAADAFAAFAQAVTQGAGITLDQGAINAVQTSLR